MENPLEGVLGKVDDLKKEVEKRVQRGPLGIELGGLLKGKSVQKVIRASGFTVRTHNGMSPVTIEIQLAVGFPDISTEDAQNQAHQVGELVTELLPLFAAFTDGITPDELVEVASGLPSLQGISPNLRNALIGLAQDLQKNLGDGKLSAGEALTTFIAFARTSVGL